MKALRTRTAVAASLAAACIASLVAVVAPATPAGASTVTFVVNRNAMGGWTDASSGTAAGSFVAASGAPLGAGAYEMTTGAGTTQTGGLQTIAKASYAGTPISDLSVLSYSTFEPIQDQVFQQKNGSPEQVLAASVSLPISTGSTTATLHFEPYYSTTFGGRANPTPMHALAYDTWQSWDALAGTWWSGSDIPGVCAKTCYVSWSTIVASNPGATVGAAGIGFTAGQSSPGAPWQNWRGSIDGVTIATGAQSTTYDFEPVRYPSRPGNSQGWGATDSGASSISLDDDPAGQRNLGAGSVHFGGTGAPRSDVSNANWTNFKLTDFVSMSYDTYITQPAASPNLAPQMIIDCRGCGVVTGSLIFDPAANSFEGAVAGGRWQHWDARTGLWSLSTATTVGQLQTIEQWQAQYPLATISTVRFGVGGGDASSPWTGFVGRADAVNLGVVYNGARLDATYDFEPAAATITGFTPDHGPAGTLVTITGTHFGTTGANVPVAFNGTSTTGTVANANTINATVPAGATTGVVTIVLPGGAVVSTTNFITGNEGLRTYEQTDRSFSYTGSGWQTLTDAAESGGSAMTNPNAGTAATVSFTGSTIHWVGLRGPNTATASVSVDGGPATTVDTYASAYQPQQVLFAQTGLASGDHTLRISYLGVNPSASLPAYLVVDAVETQAFQPSISAITPGSAPPGAAVLISGSHLDGVTGVSFNGTAATFSIVSPWSVLTTVPVGATSGAITVTAGPASTTAGTLFSVTAAPPATLERHEETDGVFSFSGGGAWTRWFDSTAGGGESGGAAMKTTVNGAYADVNFTGPSVQWIGLKGPNTAIASVAIDGVSYGNVDTYATAYAAKQVLFQASGLSRGVHVMRLTYTGRNAAAATTSYLVVDAVDLAPPSPVITSFDPTGGPAGTVMTVRGLNLGGVTSVTVNGVAAAATVNSPSQITVSVPSGATQGLVSVADATGTSFSLSPFTPAAAAMHRYEQTNAAFHFPSGQGWFPWNDISLGGGESGGSAMITAGSANYVDITVTGETVDIVSLRGPYEAIASISIDNAFAGTVDTYAPTFSAQQVIFTASGLSAGPHTVRITYAGRNPAAQPTSYVVVDAVEASGTF